MPTLIIVWILMVLCYPVAWVFDLEITNIDHAVFGIYSVATLIFAVIHLRPTKEED